MPAPLLLTVPFIGALISKVIDFLVEAFGKKLTVSAILVASTVASYAVLSSVLSGLASQISLVTSSDFILYGLSLLPSNFDDAIGIVVATRAARFVWDFQTRVIDLRAGS